MRWVCFLCVMCVQKLSGFAFMWIAEVEKIEHKNKTRHVEGSVSLVCLLKRLVKPIISIRSHHDNYYVAQHLISP